MRVFLFITLYICAAYAALDPEPLVIGHRGAPMFVPEHSLASYAIAIRENVDFIEPDLQITKDGRYINMHDPDMTSITNVDQHPEFASRKTTYTFPNGASQTGFFVKDFTLDEIKTLRLKQRVPSRDQIYNGLFNITTIEDALEGLKARNALYNKTIGIYIEPKHPAFYAQYNLTFDNLFPILAQYYPLTGDEGKAAPIFLQCFEKNWLAAYRSKTSVRFIMLIDTPQKVSEDTKEKYETYLTPAGLDSLVSIVDGLGPNKHYFYTAFEESFKATITNPDTLTGEKLVQEAHHRQLRIHPWSVRNAVEDPVVNQYFEGSVYKENMYLLDLGLDGIFTEAAAETVCARNDYVAKKKVGPVVLLGATVGVVIGAGVIFAGIGILATYLVLRKKMQYSPLPSDGNSNGK